MQVFLDTEFVNTPAGPEFLSFGMCLADGHELYLEREEASVAELTAAHSNDFLKAHVLDQLGRVAGARAPLDDMARLLRDWVDALGYAELEAGYDFSTDFLLVEQLMARMSQAPRTRLVPFNVDYLFEDEQGIRAAETSWSATEASRGLRRHPIAAHHRSTSSRSDAQSLPPTPAK